jgi:Family of unknown function (DUF6069)
MDRDADAATITAHAQTRQEQGRGQGVTTPPFAQPGGARDARPAVEAGRLWAGGAAAALVAALVALVGVLIARGLFDIPVFGPAEAGILGDSGTVRLAALAGVAALVATGLMHLLLLTTPRPLSFFGWILALLTLIVTLAPLLTDAPTAEKLATSAIYLAIGITITSLVSGVARSGIARRRR